MNKLTTTLIGIAILAIVFVALGPLFILNEGEQAVITRFGEIIRTSKQPGPHLKLPVIDQVTKYPNRIMAWDGDPRRIPTAEQQFIWVDATARWRIVDPARFYAAVTTVQGAYGRLDEVIDSSVRTVISGNRLVEAVRNSNIINEIDRSPAAGIPESEIEEAETTEELQELLDTEVRQPEIRKGRQELSDEMMVLAEKATLDFGVDLLDVVIRQIRYSEDLTESVYNRMISERNRVAQALRSDGEGQRLNILGQLENEKARILSGAYERAETIRGEADAEATRLYAAAYDQDTEFFEFWRAVESYRTTLPRFRKTLTTDMDYFRFLYNAGGQ